MKRRSKRSWGALTLVAASLVALGSCSDAAGEREPYVFTTDWFSWNKPVWTSVLGDLKGKPGLRYLEIGVYEGMSALWMMDHVLTHPSSRCTFIDIEITENLIANIEKSGRGDAIEIVEGFSQTELRRLPLDSYDIIYIDGSHTGADVLADAVQSWELLKVGGVLIFDDYRWDQQLMKTHERMARVLTPRPAIDAFLELYAYEIELLHWDYQVIVRKRTNPCRGAWMCSPLGPYAYLWEQRNLVPPDDPDRAVQISDQERELIESFLESKEGARAIRDDPIFTAVCERLELDL